MSSLKAHLVYQVETLRSPLIMLMLVVCPENEFYQSSAIKGSASAYIPRLITESFKKLLAYRVGDTG